MFPEIRDLVCGRKLSAEPAVLYGYQRYVVRGATFPGIVKRSDSSVEGHILMDLTESEMESFDRYEDSFYIRESELFSVSAGKFRAEVYVVPEEISEAVLTSKIWSREWFEKAHYNEFLNSLKHLQQGN